MVTTMEKRRVCTACDDQFYACFFFVWASFEQIEEEPINRKWFLAIDAKSQITLHIIGDMKSENQNENLLDFLFVKRTNIDSTFSKRLPSWLIQKATFNNAFMHFKHFFPCRVHQCDRQQWTMKKRARREQILFGRQNIWFEDYIQQQLNVQFQFNIRNAKRVDYPL